MSTVFADVTIKEEKPTFASVLGSKDGAGGGIDKSGESDTDDDVERGSVDKTSNAEPKDQLFSTNDAKELRPGRILALVMFAIVAVWLGSRPPGWIRSAQCQATRHHILGNQP